LPGNPFPLSQSIAVIAVRGRGGERGIGGGKLGGGRRWNDKDDTKGGVSVNQQDGSKE